MRACTRKIGHFGHFSGTPQNGGFWGVLAKTPQNDHFGPKSEGCAASKPDPLVLI